MNAIQKATFAASALAITLVGAALVTAPIAFARPLPLVAHSDCTTSSLQLAHVGCGGLDAGAGLIALNRR
ncbi:MAG TPA: hypothetical protein VGG63_10740 [Steroidobacteraceae bacterium]|jgi:hypothetical protein